jgi:hypothetical protein
MDGVWPQNDRVVVLEPDHIVAQRGKDMLGQPHDLRAPGVDAHARGEVIGRIDRFDLERVVVDLLPALEEAGVLRNVGQLVAIQEGGIDRKDDLVGCELLAVDPV